MSVHTALLIVAFGAGRADHAHGGRRYGLPRAGIADSNPNNYSDIEATRI